MAGGDDLRDTLDAPARNEEVQKQADEKAAHGRGQQDVPPGELGRERVDSLTRETEKDELDDAQEFAKRDDSTGRDDPDEDR